MSKSEPGWGALFSGTNAIRSLALAGGTALHAVSVYITITILPSAVEDIGGKGYYAWNTTLFVAASILGAALSPRLLAALGPKAAYGAAALTFALGAAVCGLAPAMWVLILGRVIQGLGGGAMLALSYAMIRLTLDESLWSRGMGLVSGMWGIATLLGPAVGGVFAEFGAWRLAFWVAVPLAILFTLLAAAILPKQGDGERSAVPLPQLAVLTVAVLAVSWGSVQAELPLAILGLAIALVLMAALVVMEHRTRTRILPWGSFRPSLPLAPLFAAMGLLAVTVTSTEIFLPLFLQTLYHQTPLVAGFIAALMSAGWTTGSISSSGAGPTAASRVIRLAPVVTLLGMMSMIAMMPVGGAGNWWLLAPICVALFCIGVSVGSTWPHLLTRTLQAAPDDEKTLAASAMTTVQLFATALGTALAGMVVNHGGLLDPGGVAGTASAARWLFAVFAVAPLLCLPIAARIGRQPPSTGQPAPVLQ